MSRSITYALILLAMLIGSAAAAPDAGWTSASGAGRVVMHGVPFWAVPMDRPHIDAFFPDALAEDTWVDIQGDRFPLDPAGWWLQCVSESGEVAKIDVIDVFDEDGDGDGEWVFGLFRGFNDSEPDETFTIEGVFDGEVEIIEIDDDDDGEGAEIPVLRPRTGVEYRAGEGRNGGGHDAGNGNDPYRWDDRERAEFVKPDPEARSTWKWVLGFGHNGFDTNVFHANGDPAQAQCWTLGFSLALRWDLNGGYHSRNIEFPGGYRNEPPRNLNDESLTIPAGPLNQQTAEKIADHFGSVVAHVAFHDAEMQGFQNNFEFVAVQAQGSWTIECRRREGADQSAVLVRDADGSSFATNADRHRMTKGMITLRLRWSPDQCPGQDGG